MKLSGDKHNALMKGTGLLVKFLRAVVEQDITVFVYAYMIDSKDIRIIDKSNADILEESINRIVSNCELLPEIPISLGKQFDPSILRNHEIAYDEKDVGIYSHGCFIEDGIANNIGIHKINVDTGWQRLLHELIYNINSFICGYNTYDILNQNVDFLITLIPTIKSDIEKISKEKMISEDWVKNAVEFTSIFDEIFKSNRKTKKFEKNLEFVYQSEEIAINDYSLFGKTNDKPEIFFSNPHGCKGFKLNNGIVASYEYGLTSTWKFENSEIFLYNDMKQIEEQISLSILDFPVNDIMAIKASFYKCNGDSFIYPGKFDNVTGFYMQFDSLCKIPKVQNLTEYLPEM